MACADCEQRIPALDRLRPYQEYADGHLCFIEPSRPYIRRWLKRVPTADAVERLATAIEVILRASGAVNDLRWWTEAEAAGG